MDMDLDPDPDKKYQQEISVTCRQEMPWLRASCSLCPSAWCWPVPPAGRGRSARTWACHASFSGPGHHVYLKNLIFVQTGLREMNRSVRVTMTLCISESSLAGRKSSKYIFSSVELDSDPNKKKWMGGT